MKRDQEGRSGERKCVVTGDFLSRDELIRFVCDPEGKIVPDLAERLPGRGVWVRADRDVIKRAVGRNVLAQAFRDQAAKPCLDDSEVFVTLVANQQKARALQAIGLARRAGALIIGFDKVRESLRRNISGACLLIACDAGEDGAQKLERFAVQLQKPVSRSFAIADISEATGMEHVAYLFVSSGTRPPDHGARVLKEIKRFDQLSGATCSQHDHRVSG